MWAAPLPPEPISINCWPEVGRLIPRLADQYVWPAVLELFLLPKIALPPFFKIMLSGSTDPGSAPQFLSVNAAIIPPSIMVPPV